MADREPNFCSDARYPQFPPKPPDEAAFLRTWDNDIKRAARAAANGDRAAEDDLAQQVRARLLVASRAMPDAPTPYLRAVIANTVRTAARRERRSFSARSPMALKLSENLEAPAEEPEDERVGAVVAWATRLPARLQDAYCHLYIEQLSQRETARLMKVSQPRVAQLHRQLLDRGREELRT